MRFANFGCSVLILRGAWFIKRIGIEIGIGIGIEIGIIHYRIRMKFFIIIYLLGWMLKSE